MGHEVSQDFQGGPESRAPLGVVPGSDSAPRGAELALLRHRALQALRPPLDMALADWIEGNVYLPQTASALPGRMRLWEYQRGICAAIDDPAIERVTVLKSARIGYTALLSGIIANYVSNSPAPILAVQPTSDDARDYAVDLEQVFEASPKLRGLLSDEADETGRSTMLNRRFPGGSLKFLAAKSPRNLRRHTAKVLILDEIDGFEVSQEGDPIELATMRTLTFRDRKIIAGSTPVFDYGPATRLYEQSDRRIFEVPCPECSDFAEIRWADIHWPEGNPEAAQWCCPNCGCMIEERHKPGMVAAGRWRATAPEVTGHAGFRINALVSPHHNARWGKLAAEFLKAKRSPDTLQTFTNLVLGEAWKTEGDDLDEHELYRKREGFNLAALPAEVLWLTAGVDCQDDRLEAVIMGHGESEIFVLDHRVFWGPIDGEAVWQDLDSMLGETWQHPKGGTIRVDAACIDSGDGGHTEIVHSFTRGRFRRRVVSIKGACGFSRAFVQRSTSRGAMLWLCGVDAIKAQLFARLSRGQGVRFADALEPVYFEQLTSERRVMRYVRGRPEARFERIKGKRAETLDATVYAWAARQLIGQKIEARQEEVSSAAAPPKRDSVIRSKWLDR